MEEGSHPERCPSPALFWRAQYATEVELDHRAALSRLERALAILESEFGQDHAQTAQDRASESASTSMVIDRVVGICHRFHEDQKPCDVTSGTPT